jgi:hypothetical protein
MQFWRRHAALSRLLSLLMGLIWLSPANADEKGSVTVVAKEPVAIPTSVLKSDQKVAFIGAVGAEKNNEIRTGQSLEDARKLIKEGFTAPKFIGAIDVPGDEFAKSWAFYKGLNSFNVAEKTGNPEVNAEALKAALVEINLTAGKGKRVFLEWSKPNMVPPSLLTANLTFVGLMQCSNHNNPRHGARNFKEAQEKTKQFGCSGWEGVGVYEVSADSSPELLRNAKLLDKEVMTAKLKK